MPLNEKTQPNRADSSSFFISNFLFLLLFSLELKKLEGDQKSSLAKKGLYGDVMNTVDDFFLQMGPKHYNIDERSVWTAWGTILKNKPHLVTFLEVFWSAC